MLDRTDAIDLIASVERASREAFGLRWVFEEAAAASLGLNKTDLECLDIILAERDVSAGRLAEATGLTTGAITGVIDRLGLRGYAERQPDRSDRRRTFLRPPPNGTSAALRLQISAARMSERLLSKYAPAELRLLLDHFKRSAALARIAIEELRVATVTAAGLTSNGVGAE